MIIEKYIGIRLYITYGLIFFIGIAFSACSSKTENETVRIVWKGKSAHGIYITEEITGDLSADSAPEYLKIKLADSKDSVSILGNYTIENEAILFEPLVPFTRGLHYEVVFKNKVVATFEIPFAAEQDAPRILAIYPSQDTLPENLLKIYLHFSQPMQEGKSDGYVSLVKNNSDTVKGVFLNLQPELWNEDRTMLTLWLDPGRIKRDLQPNKVLGAPLKKYEHYQILISNKWRDEQGNALAENYVKSFRTTSRDSLSPQPDTWTVNSPQKGSKEVLEVGFGEALDYSLILESLDIITTDGKIIAGKWDADNEEKSASFTPKEYWTTGKYKLRVLTKLEDLAGNNINRPFDRDITKTGNKVLEDRFIEVVFSVGK